MRLGGHCGDEMPELFVTRWDERLGVRNRPQPSRKWSRDEPLAAGRWEGKMLVGCMLRTRCNTSPNRNSPRADAEARGWIDEAQRHRRLIARLDALLSEAG